MGVRQYGSSLGRWTQHQRAEAGGVCVLTTYCKTNPDGIIEILTGDPNNTDIALIGYLTGCSYTEITPTSLLVISDGTWRTVGDSAWADRVVDILIGNVNYTAEREVGVRATGSALQRTFLLTEREAAGTSYAGSILVQADGSGNFEGFKDAGAGGGNIITVMGYFSLNVSFTEAHTDEVAGTDTSWGNETVTPPADSLAYYVLTNSYGIDEQWVGIRQNGSSINRRFNIHEAEAGGLSGFGDLVNVDGSQIIENYIENGAYCDLWYEGYLTLGPFVGWTHKFLGVPNANIAKIMGVAKANINKVLGVA